ncbi:MAG: AMP-binding protein [Paludibacteraceae bacterium]|nr:AMP-binding protein [Paludibacteraceae bacterium]
MNKRITIIDFVEKYTRQYADKTYLREKVGSEWVETSFEATRKEAYRLGAGLMALGLNKGERIALLSEARNRWVFGELGILYAGGVNVPLSQKLEPIDLKFRIQHSDAKYVMVSENQLPKIREIIAECPLVEKVIVFDNGVELQKGEMLFDEIETMGDAFLKDHEADFVARYKSVGPDDYANISYTSGTTADPKGILLTHRNYTANVEQAHSVIDVPMDSTMLIILPMDHCFAHVAGFYFMMSAGGSIATVPVGKTAMASLRNIPMAIQETRPHVMLSVPALSRNFKKNIEGGIKKKGEKVERLYNFALNMNINYYKEYWNQGGIGQLWKRPLMALFDKLIFKAVRQGLGGRMLFFVGGGALLDIELQRYYNAIGIPVFQGYGLSEATPIICANSEGHAIFGSSGRIVSPMECKICDADGKEVPTRTRGEIVIKGENVMAGYWKNPKATEETIIDGWLHTGDMGYLDDRHPGYLWVVGRFKSLLISSDGEKYSPEGFEDGLTDYSPYVDNTILHNSQDPYTIALIVPNKENLKEYAKRQGLDSATAEGKKAMLQKIQDEVNTYKKGGKHFGLFPERWLPAALVICDEPWTEQNHLVNSTMKVVRGKVEKYFADRIAYAYTEEGKNLFNEKNMAAFND